MSNTSFDGQTQALLSETVVPEISDAELNTAVEEQDSESEFDGNISRKLLWQSRDLSIRELKSMSDDGDLILRPKYQRNFVASVQIASRLVESVLLDVPIPTIYLAEEYDSKLSVIDGQQRLTSFISFLNGNFPGEVKPFRLSGLQVLRLFRLSAPGVFYGAIRRQKPGNEKLANFRRWFQSAPAGF